jgi:predicted ribosomally synthesized peptide with SipW-like signal peptide
MRKILGLTVAALLVMGLVGGGTWAFFTSEASVAGNTVTAGTLTLSVASGTPQQIDIVVGGNTSEPIYPGSRGIAADWALDNTGSIPGDLSVNVTAVTDSGASGIELADNLYVLFWLDSEDDGNLDSTDIVLANGSSGNWSGSENTELTAIDEGDMVLLSAIDDQAWSDIFAIPSNPGTPPSFNIYYYFYDDSTNQNDCQGDVLEFDVNFQLTQQ